MLVDEGSGALKSTGYVKPIELCGHTCYDLLANGRKDIPLPVMIFWCLLIWAVAVGSYPWIVECVDMLKAYFPAGETVAAEL